MSLHFANRVPLSPNVISRPFPPNVSRVSNRLFFPVRCWSYRVEDPPVVGNPLNHGKGHSLGRFSPSFAPACAPAYPACYVGFRRYC